jgi:PilZ domain
METMAEQKTFLEKRLRARIPVKIPVQIRRVEDPRELESLRGRTALAKDMTLDGMFIKTGTPPRIGDVFRMDLSLPEGSRQLFAFAEVVWANETGAGLRLMMMESEDQASLKDYLDRLAAD